MSNLLTLVLVVLGVLTLLGVTVIGFVMWRYRIPPRGLIAMIGALVYLASPVDVLPEVMLGPIGLLDDAGVVTAAVAFIYKLVTVKGRLQNTGGKAGGGQICWSDKRCSWLTGWTFVGDLAAGFGNGVRSGSRD